MPTKPTLATKDPQILLDRIRQVFPDVKWNTFTYIDVGWDHEIIQLDEAYIFRFPNSPEYKAMLRDEVGLLKYLEQHLRTSIPNYVYVAEDASFGGYKIVPGEELSPEVFAKLTETQQDAAAQSIADFLTALHSIDITDLAQFNVEVEPDFVGYSNVAAEVEKYLKPNLPDHEYQTVASMLADILPVQQYPQPARLIHADVAPKHLIWNAATQTIGVIDFSDRLISDPAYDFAELYTYDEGFVNRVYGYYQGQDKNDQFLTRAKAYMKAIGIHSLTNVYRTKKITHDEAMQLVEIGKGLSI